MAVRHPHSSTLHPSPLPTLFSSAMVGDMSMGSAAEAAGALGAPAVSGAGGPTSDSIKPGMYRKHCTTEFM
jgi:hypothetical protein